MNAAQRQELDAIRREQRELQTRLQELETRLGRFERRAEETARETMVAALPAEAAPLPVPKPVAATPPPLPVMPVRAPEPAAPAVPAPPARPPLPVVPPIPPAPPDPAAPRESLEMQIGTTWLVRAGVVLVLTSLAFLGSYLYYHIVPTLGPAAKVALLYLGAGALTGVGAWLERGRSARENASLKNYARVVLAGGLAAVYYVTYAAHWNPHLRVVSDPWLAGGLLLGWAAFMVWLANRLGSELLATFAILLAFYTSAVNEISSFTLVANLFLAGGAVYLLRHNLWRIFPFASLLATFGSYGFWRYSHAYIEGSALTGDAPPRMALAPAGFWTEGGFLLVYWLLFTWAVFAPESRTPRTKDSPVPDPPEPRAVWWRAGFVTANNSAFFLLTTWLQLAAYPGSFWKLALGFGLGLLVLAELCRRLPWMRDAATEDAYLLQGVLLVTLGFVGYFSGWQLSLVLAVQSVVLLWRAGERESRLRLGLSGAVAFVSFLHALDGLHTLDVARAWAVGLAEGALLVGNAWWCRRLLENPRADGPAPAEAAAPNFRSWLVQMPPFFAFLGSAVWFWMIERPVTAEVGHAPLLALAALLLTASVYALRLWSLPWLAQGFLVAAHLHWLDAYAGLTGWQPGPPWWNPLALLAVTLALGHWWDRRRVATDLPPPSGTRAPAALEALLAVVLLNFWLRSHAAVLQADAGWMAEAALLSLAVMGYGVFTRYRALAVASQLLLLASVLHFFGQFDHPWFAEAYHPWWSGDAAERWLALVPLAATLATIAVGRRFVAPDEPARRWVRWGFNVYECLAMVLFVAWVVRYVPRDLKFVTFCSGGAATFALGCFRREKGWQVLSVVPTLLALAIFWLAEDSGDRRSWLSLAGAVILAAQQQFSKRWLQQDASEYFPAKVQAALMVAAVFCAWAFLTARMARWEGSAFTLAASWSLYAPLVFALGLVLRERVYRWLGLLILAATLGHIVLFDISQLDMLGKAISFFVLGLVALGVGFFYVRFQSKFRDLL